MERCQPERNATKTLTHFQAGLAGRGIYGRGEVKVNELLVRLERVRRNGKGWTARCPAHDDRNPSLSISEERGKILLCCHAGCSSEAICAAVGITMSDLFAQNESTPRFVETYPYTDEKANLLYEVVRYSPKTFRQRRPDECGGWIWNLKTVRRVPYRLPDVLCADGIIICEGEKDCDTASKMGLVATCNPGGAGKWDPKFGEFMRDKPVVVIADADAPGLAHAHDVARSLIGVAAEVKLIEALPLAKDLTEYREKGGTPERLLQIFEETPVLTVADVARWTPAKSARGFTLTPLGDLQQSDAGIKAAVRDEEPRRPTLNDAAMHGLAGRVVNTILPHSEADPVALLLHFLAGYGSVIGRSAYCQVESTRHYSNIFFGCVGETAKGRKGTAWNRVRDVLLRIDGTWARERIQSGLSSGEGLIATVADHDSAATDRRLFVLQPELASTLKVMAREGNTLSPLIREAWDSGSLRTLVKHDPLHVEGAHISLVGHITREELLRSLSATESANGFANRFLWARCARSKPLPEGGSLSERDMDSLAELLRPAVAFGRVAGLLKRDDAARELWAEVYPELSDGKPGLVGAVTSRAEAQVLRLSMLYALLDCSDEIRLPHLVAALALWDYCEKSARWIFGDALGDPAADTILSELRRADNTGLTRSQISALFGRHRTATEIELALRLLREKGLAHPESAGTDGRTAEIWFIDPECERSERSEKRGE